MIFGSTIESYMQYWYLFTCSWACLIPFSNDNDLDSGYLISLSVTLSLHSDILSTSILRLVSVSTSCSIFTRLIAGGCPPCSGELLRRSDKFSGPVSSIPDMLLGESPTLPPLYDNGGLPGLLKSRELLMLSPDRRRGLACLRRGQLEPAWLPGTGLARPLARSDSWSTWVRDMGLDSLLCRPPALPLDRWVTYT